MENKTVVHKGSVYEIGAHYLFSVYGTSWTYGILTDIDPTYKKPFCTNNHEWLYIKEIPSATNGTIAPAPVELINGNAYMFDISGSFDLIGTFECSTHGMWRSHGKISLSLCTNIREMTVKEGD